MVSNRTESKQLDLMVKYSIVILLLVAWCKEVFKGRHILRFMFIICLQLALSALLNFTQTILKLTKLLLIHVKQFAPAFSR